MEVIEKENIVVKDIRFEKYANVIFDFNIYETRKKIREYLKNLGIETIGRFGEGDYFWSDQSLLSRKLNKDKLKNNKDLLDIDIIEKGGCTNKYYIFICIKKWIN